MAYETQIATAAIAADMDHRGWDEVGGGTFEKRRVNDPGGQYLGTHHSVVTFSARDGSTSIEQQCSSCGATDHELFGLDSDLAELRGLQAQVFDYWHGAVGDLFHTWVHEVPQETAFSVGAALASQAVTELSTGVSFSDDGSGYSAGNPRLASDLSNLETRTKQLAGVYASTFSDNYVTPLAPVLERQRSLAAILEIALRAETEIWRRTRADVLEIMSQSVAAMEAARPRRAGGGDLAVVLTVVGAVAAGVATFASGGSTLAVAASLGAKTAGVAKSFLKSPPEPEPPNLPLGAADPHAVLKKIDEALNHPDLSLSATIRAQEEFIQDILADANAAAVGTNKGMFDLPRPEIATAPSGDVLKPEQDVVVTPDLVAKITHLWMPTIVSELRVARRLLPWESTEAWQRPGGIGLGPIGPHAAYLRLQETVIDLLGNTARDLEDAAGALDAAATLIGMADEEARQTYSQQAEEIIMTNQNHVG